MSQDTLEILRQAGAQVDALSPAERDVFAELNEQEVSILSSIQDRLNSAARAVEGQAEPDTNNVLC